MTRREDSLMRCVLTDTAATDMEKRYEHRRRLWLDGPYGGSVAFDKVMEREVGLYIAYNFSDIPAFIRRAKVRGRLRHSHLLPVFDLGLTADNLPYFTEPYVTAQSLCTLFQSSEHRSPLPLPRLVRMLRGVCRAVAYAHGNGACHLDLHPSAVHVVDASLGDAFLTGGWEEVAGPAPTDRCRQLGCVAISLGYAAPEQVRLSKPELIRRGLWRTVDVYGLGGILYWALYDSPPNQTRSGAGSSVLEAIGSLTSRQGSPCQGQPRPTLEAGGPTAIAGLGRIAQKALHSEPRRRYPTVNDMVAALEQWLVEDLDTRPWWKFWSRRHAEPSAAPDPAG